MRFEVVAVLDAAVGGYSRPFFTPSIGAAVRSFIDEVNRQADDNQMSKHPQDFSLYHLGSFDDSTGELLPCQPELVSRGSQAVTRGSS